MNRWSWNAFSVCWCFRRCLTLFYAKQDENYVSISIDKAENNDTRERKHFDTEMNSMTIRRIEDKIHVHTDKWEWITCRNGCSTHSVFSLRRRHHHQAINTTFNSISGVNRIVGKNWSCLFWVHFSFNNVDIVFHLSIARLLVCCFVVKWKKVLSICHVVGHRNENVNDVKINTPTNWLSTKKFAFRFVFESVFTCSSKIVSLLDLLISDGIYQSTHFRTEMVKNHFNFLFTRTGTRHIVVLIIFVSEEELFRRAKKNYLFRRLILSLEWGDIRFDGNWCSKLGPLILTSLINRFDGWATEKGRHQSH